MKANKLLSRNSFGSWYAKPKVIMLSLGKSVECIVK